jgi:membrane-associated phospholipid phosphatase
VVSRVVRFVSAAGFELLGGLIVLTASAWLFGWMVEDLQEGDTQVDEHLANWLHDHATPALTRFFETVTVLGNLPTLVLVVVVAGVFLWRRRWLEDLTLLVVAAVGAEVLTVGLKEGFRRERPFFADPLATEHTFSFPSGHASVSLAVYGTLGYIAARHLETRRAQVLALASAAVLVLLIGFSRLYLGVHFLSDVVAGYSVALAWTALCVVLLQLRLRVRRRRQTSRYLASAKQ